MKKIPLYTCNPLAYKECLKDTCYLFGGECKRTTKKEYAMDPDEPDGFIEVEDEEDAKV